MPDVTETVKPATRDEWRAWLAAHHDVAPDIWLLFDDRNEVATVSYLDAVEEALCFGWVDSVAKRLNVYERAQRFSPRRPRSNWTELNKARARRLIALGLMTEAGRRVLPDLDAPFVIAPDIRQALERAGAWAYFAACPELYQRIRVGYVEEQRRNEAEFSRRLANLVARSAAGTMFGGWDDGGRLP